MREEMISSLVETVKEVMGTKCEVHFRKVEKNNGLVLQSVEIMELGANIVPRIYIDEMLEAIELGNINLHDAAGKIVGIYREAKDNSYDQGIQKVVSSINREYILERVVYQVVNKKRNAGRVVNMPHKDLLDLAAIYRVVIDSTDRGSSFIVNKSLCDKFAITEEELDVAARRNVEISGFCVKSLASFLAEMVGMPEGILCKNPNIWVVFDPNWINGASAMLYPDCFHGLAEQLGNDLYVLPSSIYEVIVVPVGDVEPDDLRDIVRFVNANEVAADEVLSDNVYRYIHEEGVLVIA